MLVSFLHALPKTRTQVHELNLGESLRIGDYVVTVLDSDDGEVRIMVESIGDAEFADEGLSWDDSWQSRLGD